MAAAAASCSSTRAPEALVIGQRAISASFPPFAPAWPAASPLTSPAARAPRLARDPSLDAVAVTTATVATATPSARSAAVATLLAALAARLKDRPAQPPVPGTRTAPSQLAAPLVGPPAFRPGSPPPAPTPAPASPVDRATFAWDTVLPQVVITPPVSPHAASTYATHPRPPSPSFAFTLRPMHMTPALAPVAWPLPPARDSGANTWHHTLTQAALTPSLASLDPEAEVWERRLREGWVDRNGDARGGGAWPRGTADDEEGSDSESDGWIDGADELLAAPCFEGERPAR